jgi:hypothetical protein
MAPLRHEFPRDGRLWHVVLVSNIYIYVRYQSRAVRRTAA